MQAPGENVVARLTPPGTAALATLGLHGPQAWTMLRGLFQTVLPAEPVPGTFRLGRLGDELGRDEVVLAVRPGCVLEIHSHGGQQVVQWLLEIFEKKGAAVCSWQDFERHTCQPGWQVAAMDALAHAPTVRTAGILLDQYHGALHRALGEIVQHLQKDKKAEARGMIETLLARAELGLHLVQPWRVVIAGAVNVGKSSLVNALAGHTRSVVSPQPGTTRDVVTTRLALDGWPVEIADTAGWRTAAEPLEQAGLALARSAQEQADLILWVVDGSTPPVLPPADFLRGAGGPPAPCNVQASRLHDGKPVFVINKCDLAAGWDFGQLAGALQVSARTGEGVTSLCQHIANVLVPAPPAVGEPVPFSTSMCAGVGKTRAFLNEGKITEAVAVLGHLESE